ncbi:MULTISPECIES: DUF2914 domain-containing protein [Pseudoalteromonas]|uniref:DUF2914 domain-containing protein n=1 Tax=Pseudoalteromonas TaxID=53246 RepID=UPI001EF4C90A|nr:MULTISPECIES: DUF2914 domain-containing protein [Pseudoalteromonas]MCG7563931.1 DUF2914 domain-containing protein [Pseudoalteromonas sp. McH1-42]MEC4091325.1 DUF2914 domain-containing protein [Pseudoalteromonas rubra]
MTQRIVIKTAVTKASEAPAKSVTYQYHWRRIGVVGSAAAFGLAALFYGIVNSVSADEQPVTTMNTYQQPEQADGVIDTADSDFLEPASEPERRLASEPVSATLVSEPVVAELPQATANLVVSATVVKSQDEPELTDEEAVVADEQETADLTVDYDNSNAPTKRFAEDAQVASVAMAAQVDTKHISRAVLTTEVMNREPVNVLKDSVEQSAFADKLYFFTEVRGLQGQTIRHLWFHQDQLMAEIDLAISAYRHRTYSSKNIMPSQSGQWRIEVITADDRLLAQKTFRIIATAQ